MSCPESLRKLLPTPPSATYPLIVGQYWLIGTTTTDINKGTIVRIDDRKDEEIIITKWTVKMANKTYKRSHSHKQFVVPYD